MSNNFNLSQRDQDLENILKHYGYRIDSRSIEDVATSLLTKDRARIVDKNMIATSNLTSATPSGVADAGMGVMENILAARAVFVEEYDVEIQIVTMQIDGSKSTQGELQNYRGFIEDSRTQGLRSFYGDSKTAIEKLQAVAANGDFSIRWVGEADKKVKMIDSVLKWYRTCKRKK